MPVLKLIKDRVLLLLKNFKNGKAEKKYYFNTTKQFDLPPTVNRFPNNVDLQERLDEVGLLTTLAQEPEFKAKFTDGDWKVLTIEELLSIIYTQGSDMKLWNKLHRRALKEITTRPQNIRDAVETYNNYSCVQAQCGGDYFMDMFNRLTSGVSEGTKKMLWKIILDETPEHSDVHKIAILKVEGKKVKAA